jgi:hypothetical protein
MLLEARLLHDRGGELGKLLGEAARHWPLRRDPYTPAEAEWERFTQRHVFDKVEFRLESEPAWCHFLLNANMLWLAEDYIRLQGLREGDFRGALRHMKEHAPELDAEWREFHATLDLARKLKLARSITERVLAPLGGSWRDDEVIFHHRDTGDVLGADERRRVMDLLFT